MTFPERDYLYLKDMLLYAKTAVDAAGQTTREALPDALQTRLVIERCIEIVGEASKNVSNESKAILPALPWRAMAKTRDIFAHHYFRIDLDILWRICNDELPLVIQELEKVLS
jgi:uncharacterized protein with HEPN domain